MRQYCQGVHRKKSCLNEQKGNTGIRCSQHRKKKVTPHTMTNSSSKQQQLQQQQYSKTHFVHSSSRQVHTNNILVRSAAASGETAHHVYGTKRNGNSNNTQQREQRRQQHYVRTRINWLNVDYSDELHVCTLVRTKNRNVTKKKRSIVLIRTTEHVKGTASYLYT